MLPARAMGGGLALVSALWCAPRVVFSIPAAGPVNRLVVGPGGDLWVAGSVIEPVIPVGGVAGAESTPFVTRLDPAGYVRWTTVLPSAPGTAAGATAWSLTVDGAGNAYIVGEDKLSGSQILNGIARPLPSPWRFGPGSAWLVKLDPGGRVSSYSLFGGSGRTWPTDIAVDASGGPVVIGRTADPDFPTTPGAVGGSPRRSGMYVSPYGFVMRFLPDARSVVFSTCLGGTERQCVGGSRCDQVVAETVVWAAALDGSGRIYVAGSSSATDFLRESLAPGLFFLAVISADGSRLISATRLPAAPEIGAMRLTSTGQLVMAATTAIHGLPTTPGAAQSEFRGCPPGQYPLCYQGGCTCPVNNGYAFQVDVNGQIVRATYLGGHSATVSYVALDAGGNVWVSGDKAGDDFPDTPGGLARGGEFLMKLDGDTFALAQAVRLPDGVGHGSIAIARNGDLYIGGSYGLVSRIALDGSGPAIFGVSGVASWSQVTGKIAPGQLVSVYGRDIGPPEPARMELDADGRVDTDLGGCRLFFQGQAAPLLYAQRDQINAVVPFGVAGMPEVNVELMHAGEVAASQKLQVVDAHPAVLGVLNSDGSRNDWNRPAPAGSVVSIYATGFGDLLPRPADGEVPIAVLPKPKAAMSALLNGKPWEIQYAGSAPGLVAGVMQVNVWAPECPWRYCQHQLILKVGSRTTGTLLYAGP